MTSELDPEIGTRIERAAQLPGTWAGGTTRAIYAAPPEALGALANARMWAGTAVIDRASAYSYFPQCMRVHVPIQGHGIRLHFQAPDEVVTLNTFAQHRFDGARPVQVELIDGPIVAFNLIVQTDVAAAAQVVRVDGDAVALDGIATPQRAGATTVVRVVYAVAGAVAIQLAGQPDATLQPDDAFVFKPRALADMPAARAVLRSLDASAEVVVATLVFE